MQTVTELLNQLGKARVLDMIETASAKDINAPA